MVAYDIQTDTFDHKITIMWNGSWIAKVHSYIYECDELLWLSPAFKDLYDFAA